MKVEETKLKMSPLQIYLTARALDEPIRQFYKRPENEEKFQEWLKSQKGGVKGEAERNSRCERSAAEGACNISRDGRADDEQV